jgi:hypothetical protein
MARREALAAKVAGQLKDSLNTVVPVSAGLHRALERLLDNGGAGLRRLMDALRRVPAGRLEKLLNSDELYRKYEFDDCPLSTDERRALMGPLDWAVFTTIARLAANPALDRNAIAAEVERIAGFAPLNEVLESHFLKRSEFLRCYRIVGDVRRAIGAIRYQHLPALRQRERDEAARRERFLAFIRGAPGDREVARELAEWVEKTAVAHAAPVKEAVEAVDRDLGRVFHTLEEYNADFEALQALEKHAGLFAGEELDELHGLLGLYGLGTAERLPAGHTRDTDYVERRQQYWRDLSMRDRAPAKRAVARLGLILDELEG